jgi:SAM-dependent methyltransferase
MPTQKRSDKYFDGWYANQAVSPLVAAVMNRHMDLPPDLLAGVVAAEAIPEITAELRLRPGDLLADLACGRGAYGLLIAASAGARLLGVDFSSEAIRQAREQATRLGNQEAEFVVGDLVATGLPAESADAVLCTDAIQFPDEPIDAYREVRRVVRPGGRVVLTGWEAIDREDERLPLKRRQADFAGSLTAAGFTEIEVRDRPAWRERELAMWQAAVALDPGDDPAIRSFHDEGVSVLPTFDLVRRVLATATAP